MLSNDSILLQSRKQRLGGYKTYKPPTFKIDDTTMKKIEDSNISLDEYIVTEQFAKYLPRGHRKLKLNMPELKDELLSKKGVNQMTDSAGLRAGGMSSRTGNFKAPPKKATKELDQKTIIYSIKNNNRIKTNPNYTSFKNIFSI